MKKILSFVLVLAMIASMMCVSVSAAGWVGYNNEGTRVGVGSFTKTDSNSAVTAAVTGDIQHRYAVDLEFTIKPITISGDFVWDVNELYYVTGDNFKVSTDYSPEGVGTAGEVKVGEFTVTNYSDLEVSVGATCSPKSDVPVAATFKLDADGHTDAAAGTDLLTPAQVTIKSALDNSAVLNNGKSGSAKSTSYTAKVSSDDWANVASVLHYQSGSAAVTVVSFTISVSPVN